MSVLSDRDIRAALEAGEIAINPYDSHDLQPSSVDLHLDKSFRVFRNNRYAFIDVRAPQPDLTELLTVEEDEPFILHPGEFVLGQTLEWVELPNYLVSRLEGKSSLGRLGLLIHSTAGYVDPGWKGNLTLELSNVANLPIALYYGMRIGQISFFRMSSPVDRPYGSRRNSGRNTRGSRSPTASARSTVISTPAAPDRRSIARTRSSPMAMNDAVDWAGDLGDGTRVALVQAGTFRSDAGTLFGPVPWVLWGDLVSDEVDDKRRLLQALNCLLIETPSGRVLVETGIGDRVDEKTRTMRGYEGPVDRRRPRDGRFPARIGRRRGDEPPAFRPCRRAAAGGRRARLPARQDRRPEGRVGGRARRQPAPRRLVRPARAGAGRDVGQAGLGRRRGRGPAGRHGRADRRSLDRSPGDRRPRHRRPGPGLSRSSATC